jgi:rhamnopyranosyl-N-acetylglucosaminyl-diphospho-decaprenol beta-1,3/1,4-galactofuranosyltransferase
MPEVQKEGPRSPVPDATTTERVCAIVVTHSRKHLLRQCLARLLEQKREADQILVVDNASTDGTLEMVRDEFPQVELLCLERNLGGAGGFHEGLAWAHRRGYDWLWAMDDDTFAVPDTLEALLSGARRAPDGQPLLVASRVLWKDETLHPINRPVPRWRWPGQLTRGVAQGLLLVRYTTFVSVALRREAIDRCGLPLAHYFIWGDDVEFTARILRDEPGYLVPESWVYHWTARPHEAATAGGDRFYYHARNSLKLLRGSSLSPVERVDYGRYFARTILQYLRTSQGHRGSLDPLMRALRDGLRGRAR